jgi:hypothetical protein
METKLKYTSPFIEVIHIDNEISLALYSLPPNGPDESNNDLFSSDLLNRNPNTKINC